ncbi:tRNA lysidine(34) synthetase TilS [Luteococcus sediminum]|uniref:tRNA lysidine(34) synthetase TilS n=1 Tax=Luteococcus sp. TaxID=1969402 RepID=UPI003734E86A
MARKALTPAQLAMVQTVRPALERLHGPVLVGVSGGADSLALAAAVAHLDAGRATAVVVDHQLQAGSAEHSQAVVELMCGLGLDARVELVEVRRDGQGLEAAARAARLEALCREGLPVLLGHTLDDQAETVLLALARGSGAASLRGMMPVTPFHGAQLVRPLLELHRAQVRQACRDWGLEPWDDPMNADPSFLRVRVRQELLPVAADVLGGGVADALARTAELARQDNDLLERLGADAVRDLARGDALDAVGLLHLHPALRGRVLRRWMVGRGVRHPSMVHVQAVTALVEDWRGQQGVDLPGGVTVRRQQGSLVAGPRTAG